MDIMFVNGMPMLTGIDRSIRFRSLVPLTNRTAPELYSGLDKILRHYNDGGYTVQRIHCDQEFKPIMAEVEDKLDVKMNYTVTDEHVPEAERNNRTIAECIRATYHNLPYKTMPKLMLRYLAMVCAHQLNLFPAKGGVSAYLSPHVLVGGQNLDFEKHCQIPFGSYVQANQENDPKNTNAPRTIDCIYLRPITRNIQGGHELMDLNSGRMITRQRVWEIPVTDVVIQAVERMGEEQGIKSLKLQNCRKTIYYPADWIAGVNYDDDNENEDENYDPNDEENENYEDDFDDDGAYDRIDQDELDELLAEPKEEKESNPVDIENENEEEQNDEAENEPGNEESNAKITDDDDKDDAESKVSTRRELPARNRAQPERLTYAQMTKKIVQFAKVDMSCHSLGTPELFPDAEVTEYNPQLAMVIARCMADINGKVTAHGASYAQQYILQKGLKKFKERGSDAAIKELDQLHKRNCFTPVEIASLTKEERRKAQEALMFLTEKRDQSCKGRLVYNGKPTREWLSREDAASPTVALESIMLTAIVDAKEGRDVMTADVPNAFIQAQMPIEEGKERVIMKITGVLVDLIVEMASEVYGPFVTFENGKKVLYVQVLRALYGMLIAALLWYKQFKSDLEQQGFKFNPYDACVANKQVKGKQHTVRFHVDDLMSSHVDSKVNDEFAKWLNRKYGKHGAVKVNRGKVHDYLGMVFDFSKPGKVMVDMSDYVKAMIKDFPIKFKPNDSVATPATDDLFSTGTSDVLSKQKAEEFHTFVAKALFMCKRARPDLHITVAVLCTRVKKPNQDDWNKLVRLMKYCNGTQNDKLILSADNLHIIKWYVDSAFAVHPDFKSHTGAVMTYGGGAAQSISRKQKLNTRSSTEAELVGTDDVSIMILWTKLFMEAQGFKIDNNILYQDNKSTMLLLNNGKRSSSQRTRAFNIRYFFLTDQIEKNHLAVEYCSTTKMVADYMSKPLQGKSFQEFRKAIMGH